MDEETTQQATVATVSQDVSQTVQENVSTVTKEVVTEEVKAVDAKKEAEEKAAQEALAQESVTVVEDTTADVSQPTYTEDTTVETPAVDTTTPVVEETPSAPVQEAPSQPVTPPTQDTTTTPPAVEETPSTPVEETPSQPVTPPAQDTTTPGAGDTTGAYADLNARIAAAAQTLVGVTDGQQCTQVVQQALALAGVSDAMQLWPDQYIMYGYYTDTPQAGNLVYYNNGGRGVDHIAIYIGNGLCVHGNFWTSDGLSLIHI